MIIRNLHLNILIGLNSFIVFFLLFEDKIDIPVYLQVIGRMHPLLLHFPIVLLFISWLLICFRRKLEKILPETKPIIGGLIFISALFASATVIIGLFLSKEGGYEGSSFEWHKWTGVALSFVALTLFYYNTRQKDERYHPLFLAGVNISLVLLLLVGHFGAALTHGDNFVLAPLDSGQSKGLDMERALVYEDAVFRILETKCLGCHSDSKPKGGLVLSDTTSMLKGGKNGPLFVAGSPMESLMVERLLLDIENKHRMPPKGKPQLMDNEIALIQAWISSGAKFNLPLSTLAKNDSLFQAVQSVYEVDDEVKYDFAAAKSEVIESLITPYRIIKPLSSGSPALVVNFYGSDFFTAESLPGLTPIASQVVSLNLSGMPVKAEDLKLLKNFSNLRELNLNYTTLKDAELASVSLLPSLKHLSISGTAISVSGIKKLLTMPTLRNVFVWNTPIDGNSLTSLIKEFPTVYIEGGEKDDGTIKLPLTAPRVTPSRSFFRKELLVSFSHPIPGVEMRYTLDGSDPDSLSATVYSKAILLNGNITLRVKAFKDGWLPSEEIAKTYRDAPLLPSRVVLDNRPHHLYRAREEESLFDLESGGNNHADGKWVGYRGEGLSANLFFDTPLAIDTLSLSVRQHYNEFWIYMYPPEKIEIWGGPDSTNIRLLGKISPSLDKPNEVKSRRMIDFPIHKTNIGYLKVKASPYQNIPHGYPGDGQKAWLFLDEIVIK